MSYLIYIKLKPETFQRFQKIRNQLNENHDENLAELLGEVLTEISCEVIDQVFGVITEKNFKGVGETEHTLDQITANLKKYMPWSITLFSNQRLVPMVNYIYDQMDDDLGEHFITYQIDEILALEAYECVKQLDLGHSAYIDATFNVFVQIVDQGVTRLIREPKKMLKFNFIVDKTLNGVINLTTQLGYRRIEKISHQFDIHTSQDYFRYFMGFLKHYPMKKECTF